MATTNQRKSRKMLKEVTDQAAEKGRGGDSVMAHLTPGEVVIPKDMASDPDFQKIMSKYFSENGADINQFTVGSDKNSINPETGQPEFLKVFGKKVGWGTVIGAGLGYLTGGASTLLTGALGATGGAAAGAVIGAAAGQTMIDQPIQLAKEAKAAQERALADQAAAIRQQADDAAAAQAAYDRQAAAMEAQAQAAREALAAQQAEAERQRLDAEKRAKEIQTQMEEERRKAAQAEASRIRARTRGGRRSLLSPYRMDTELGIQGGSLQPTTAQA